MSHRLLKNQQHKNKMDMKRRHRHNQAINATTNNQFREHRKTMNVPITKTQMIPNLTPPAKNTPLLKEEVVAKGIVDQRKCFFQTEAACINNYHCHKCEKLPKEEYNQMQQRGALKKLALLHKQPVPVTPIVCSQCNKEIGLVTAAGPVLKEGHVVENEEGSFLCDVCKPKEASNGS